MNKLKFTLLYIVSIIAAFYIGMLVLAKGIIDDLKNRKEREFEYYP